MRTGLRFGWIILLLWSSLCIASVPDWVQALKQSPLLGAQKPYDEEVLDQQTIELQTSKDRTVFHHRLIFLVGGTGRLDNFSYSITRRKGNYLEISGAWRISPHGEISAVSGNAFSESQQFESFVLYADEYVHTMTLSGVEVGSLVVLDYDLTFPRLLNCSDTYLQDSRWQTDSSVVEVVVPEGRQVTLTPMLQTAQTGVVSGNVFRSGVMKRWEDYPLSGGYSVSAARLNFTLQRAAGDKSPKSWKEISTAIAKRWREVNDSFGKPSTKGNPELGLDSLMEFLMRFEKNFRYVAVEVGDGHWVPHEPKKVRDFKYGDCKDLSFYLSSYFDQAGVTITPVMLQVPSQDPFDETCPCDRQFNHCIVGITVGSDTMYYDPTARGFGPGNLPWDDQGAWALWVRDSSDLIRLPRDEKPLAMTRILQGTLDVQGTLRGTLELRFDRREHEATWDKNSEEEIRKLLRTVMRSDLTMEVHDPEVDKAGRTIRADIVGRGYAQVGGNTIYWKPYPFRADVIDTVRSDQPHGYYAGRPLLITDSISVLLPKGFALGDPLLWDTGTTLGHVHMGLHGDSSQVSGEWISERAAWYLPPTQKAALDSFYTALRSARNLQLRVSAK